MLHEDAVDSQGDFLEEVATIRPKPALADAVPCPSCQAGAAWGYIFSLIASFLRPSKTKKSSQKSKNVSPACMLCGANSARNASSEFALAWCSRVRTSLGALGGPMAPKFPFRREMYDMPTHEQRSLLYGPWPGGRKLWHARKEEILQRLLSASSLMPNRRRR